MPADADHVQKPFCKLIKAACVSAELNDPERVHKLRTNTRRVEAILSALELPSRQKRKELLNGLKKIRRVAGQVRDMDVLTRKAADVSPEDERNCQVQLLEHLGVERHRCVKRLREVLKKHGKAARRTLKLYAEELEERGGRGPSNRAIEEQSKRATVAHAERLRKFATLTRDNLHEFRKAGKQLRYVLQMTTPRDEAFVEALREMQTAIGEWHDWEELVAIATEVLRHGDACRLLLELQLHADESFDAALKNANAVRKRYFSPGAKPVTLRLVPRAA